MKRLYRVILAFGLGVVSSTYGRPDYIHLLTNDTFSGWHTEGNDWRSEQGVVEGGGPLRRPGTSRLRLASPVSAGFELKFSFKTEGGEASLHFAGPELGRDVSRSGYEILLDSSATQSPIRLREAQVGLVAEIGQSVDLGPGRSNRRFLAHLGLPEELKKEVHRSEWNEVHLTVYGGHILLRINGRVMIECYDRDPVRLAGGYLGWQIDRSKGVKLSLREIRLRALKPGDLQEIVFLAGLPSHGYGAHEHRAGSLLLAQSLNESDLPLIARVYDQQHAGSAWPLDAYAMSQVDAVVLYCDGLGGHIAAGHQAHLQKLVDRKVGLSCLHFAVEVEKEKLGAVFLDWIGGYFEDGWSVNPHWKPEFIRPPLHATTRGVNLRPTQDEWYYHLRFSPKATLLTPVLRAVPPLSSLQISPAHSRSSNPDVLASVKRGEAQTVAWTFERPAGGRGFGYTGGHFHHNWKEDALRRLVLNAIAWTAGTEIPTDGVKTLPLTRGFLELNQDFLPPQP